MEATAAGMQAGRTYLFSACKNCNAGAAVPAVGMLAVRAFLSNISLTVFAFSGAAAAGVSG